MSNNLTFIPPCLTYMFLPFDVRCVSWAILPMQGGNFLLSFHSNIDTTLKFSRHNFSRKKTGTEIAAYCGGEGKKASSENLYLQESEAI